MDVDFKIITKPLYSIELVMEQHEAEALELFTGNMTRGAVAKIMDQDGADVAVVIIDKMIGVSYSALNDNL